MNELKTDDPEKIRAAGAIDLQTLQKYMNFHYSVSLDLFGQEISTNAANYYTAGLKGRFEESKIDDDHVLKEGVANLTMLEDGAIKEIEYNALLAVNERLRDDYVEDCQIGVSRWNKVMKRHKINFELKLPHRGFHRAIGTFSEAKISPDGNVISKAEWDKNADNWLPSEEDRAFVISLQKACIEPGKIASWVAPPSRGIDGHPFDYEYVRFN
jgi:benzoyl-CoA 2,3-dioxygenase component B